MQIEINLTRVDGAHATATIASWLFPIYPMKGDLFGANELQNFVQFDKPICEGNNEVDEFVVVDRVFYFDKGPYLFLRLEPS